MAMGRRADFRLAKPVSPPAHPLRKTCRHPRGIPGVGLHADLLEVSVAWNLVARPVHIQGRDCYLCRSWIASETVVTVNLWRVAWHTRSKYIRLQNSNK